MRWSVLCDITEDRPSNGDENYGVRMKKIYFCHFGVMDRLNGEVIVRKTAYLLLIHHLQQLALS